MPARDPALLGAPIDPAWPKQLYVITDSVLLSAKASVLKSLPDWQVTFIGRPAIMIPNATQVVQATNGVIGSVAVVGLGYNSLWQKNRQNFQRWAVQFDASVEGMLTTLKQHGVRKVVWVLLRELTPDLVPNSGIAAFQYRAYAWYFPYVNERLRAIKARHPEMALADWVTAARQQNVTYDAIHTNARGGDLMAGVVRMAIGLEPQTPLLAKSAVKAAAGAADTVAKPQLAALVPPAIVLPRSDAGGSRGTADRKASYTFRDCANCPVMVVIPGDSFMMGAPEGEPDRSANEGPQHRVTIARPLAVGTGEVTFDEWQACADAGGCKSNPHPKDEGWGRGRHPVVNVSWNDAQEYVAWLSQATGKRYRLPSEAEWEYAARAGTASAYSTGDKISAEQANFQTDFTADGRSREGTYREQTLEVGALAANPWGLFDVHGNVWQWVQDNWHEDYTGAPGDGAVMPGGDPSMRTMRGGSWYSMRPDIRSAARHSDLPDYRASDVGFRVARDL